MASAKCYLLNVPIENDYAHTYWFKSATEQSEYLSQKLRFYADDFSYMRKDGYIRFPKSYDELVAGHVNYVMYQNQNQSKWYYAFITKIEYVNPEVSKIYIETDVIQTWMFDYTVKPSLIEREHTDNDVIGSNTVPEGLETGDYICNPDGYKRFDSLLDNTSYIMATTVDINSTYTDSTTGAVKFRNIGGAVYGNVYSGCAYFYFDSQLDLTTAIVDIANKGQAEAIVSVFCCPKKEWFSVDETKKAVNGQQLTGSISPISYHWDSTVGDTAVDMLLRPMKLDGYKPNNNKLLTYPYCYLLMDNGAGGTAMYQYEYFTDSKGDVLNACDFVISYTPCPGGSITLIPINYKKVEVNYSEALAGAKLPICNFNTDTYTNWLVQNTPYIENSIAHQNANAVVGSVQTALGLTDIMNGWGGFASGVKSLSDTYFNTKSILAQKYAHSLTPPQLSGNQSTGDVMFARKNTTYTAYMMNIKKEYAVIIDNYFDMFGYMTNRVKTPNEEHRTRYWYIKTIGVNIDGCMPNDDMRKVKAIYDNGITFWKDVDRIGDYYPLDENKKVIYNTIVK